MSFYQLSESKADIPQGYASRHLFLHPFSNPQSRLHAFLCHCLQHLLCEQTQFQSLSLE